MGDATYSSRCPAGDRQDARRSGGRGPGKVDARLSGLKQAMDGPCRWCRRLGSYAIGAAVVGLWGPLLRLLGL